MIQITLPLPAQASRLFIAIAGVSLLSALFAPASKAANNNTLPDEAARIERLEKFFSADMLRFTHTRTDWYDSFMSSPSQKWHIAGGYYASESGALFDTPAFSTGRFGNSSLIGSSGPWHFREFSLPDNLVAQRGIDPALLGKQSDFSFTNAAGAQVTGVLTMPPRPRAKTVPVIVACGRLHSEHRHAFRPEIFALASMGCAVVEMDATETNGTLGVFSGDIFTALDNLARQQPALNFSQVILFGESFAGTTALELLRTNPDWFGGAIAINPVVTDNLYKTIALGNFSVSPKNKAIVFPMKTTGTASVSRLIEKPVYILAAKTTAPTNTARDVYESVRQRGVQCAFDTLPPACAMRDARTKAEVYSRIENFIHGVITNAKVDLGPMRIAEN